MLGRDSGEAKSEGENAPPHWSSLSNLQPLVSADSAAPSGWHAGPPPVFEPMSTPASEGWAPPAMKTRPVDQSLLPLVHSGSCVLASSIPNLQLGKVGGGRLGWG